MITEFLTPFVFLMVIESSQLLRTPHLFYSITACGHRPWKASHPFYPVSSPLAERDRMELDVPSKESMWPSSHKRHQFGVASIAQRLFEFFAFLPILCAFVVSELLNRSLHDGQLAHQSFHHRFWTCTKNHKDPKAKLYLHFCNA